MLKEKYPYKLVPIESLTTNNKNLVKEWNSLLDFMGLSGKEIEYFNFAGKKVNPSRNSDYTNSINTDKFNCKGYCEKLATSFGYTF